MKLYHYTKYSTLIKILSNYSLKYGDFTNTNDPTEFYRLSGVPYSDYTIKFGSKDLFDSFYKKVNMYKPISLSIDVEGREGWQIPIMWAHYGDNHKGICIEIDYDKLHFSECEVFCRVKYTNGIPQHFFLENAKNDDNNFDQIIDEYILKNRELLLFTKETTWKFEQEFRIISYKGEYLNIKDAITGIYFGLKNSKNDKKVKKIEKILKDSDISLYNLRMSDNGSGQYLQPEKLSDIRLVDYLNNNVKNNRKS